MTTLTKQQLDALAYEVAFHPLKDELIDLIIEQQLDDTDYQSKEEFNG